MESSPENPTDTSAPSTDEEVCEVAKKLVALIEATLLTRSSQEERNRGGSRMVILPEKTTTEDLQENPATDEELGEVCEEAKKLVVLIEAKLLRRSSQQEGNREGSRMEVLQEQTTTEELPGNRAKEASKENPSENPRTRECVETGVRLCSLLARTMFLKGTPISASAHFFATVKMNTTLPTIIRDTMLHDFPKVHQLIENMRKQRSKNNIRFEALLEVEMGVEDVLLGIQKDLRSLVLSETLLRVGEIVKPSINKLEKTIKELPKWELQVEILDAIRVPMGDSDFFALWSDSDDMKVSDQVNKKWMEGPKSFQGEDEKSPKKEKTRAMTLYKWVKKQPKTHKRWEALWMFLPKALHWGRSASVLLRHLLKSLPESKTRDMVIEQLKNVVKKLAEGATCNAAKRILELKIFDLKSENMAGVAGFQADEQELIYQFKMLLIRVNLIFRHPISFQGRYTASKNFDKLESSLKIYDELCDKHVDALKLKLNMSMENWMVEFEAMEESWSLSAFDIPSPD